MNPRPKHNYIEWGFVVLMVVLCATLTALQYRWTGEVARAEMTRLGGNLRDQAQLLGRAFDSEFTESCMDLLPTASELNELGREAAHVARFRKWAATNPRPIFSRIGVVVPEGNAVQLLALDFKTEKLVPMDWPPEWAPLRDNLSRRRPGPGGPGPGGPGPAGPPPNFERTGALHEFPIFDGPPQRGRAREMEWTIVELDLAYIRDTWLPELVQSYLNPEGKSWKEVEVRTAGPPGTVIYSSRADTTAKGEAGASVRFNRFERGGGDRFGRRDDGRWVLETWHRPGALEAVVAASRQRNVAVAVLLNALILAAGFLLVRHTRRSRQLSEAQMNFVATVSHELRTPLTVIRGAAHNLQRGVVHDPARIGQYASLITQHAEQLTEMVGQVLEFAAAKTKQATAQHRSVPLAEVLNDAITAAAPDAQAAHCEVELKLSPSLPCVSGDAAALRRVFQNLIANAAKHGGEGGWIGVTATATNGSGPAMVEVQIADRGPGIPEGELAEVFKPFFRGAAAQEKQTRGSGLGLSLVREIVEAHGGGISVQSATGGGATFTVRLPANL
ncbi:MAG: hypothetical protein QOE70_3647 [Chthoniobacter sp.]|jgi:signal transduction histidine kinase|nr:hypothetical protein [Chthoniobacter sp.]